MNPRLQALVDRARAVELTPRQRRLLAWSGYPLFALFVALITFYTSVPRERVKDRLETALSADPSSGQPLAIGMDVNIGELSTTLFTGLGFKANDIVLRTRPLNTNEKPARYIVDDVRVRLGLLSTIFGRPAYSFVAHALSGKVTGDVSGNNDGTKLDIAIDKLMLNGVGAIQQALSGLPVEGAVSGKLAVDVPKNLVANANGNIDIDVADLGIGDGKAKLTVPSDPFLAAGITVPRVRFGRLSGQIVIEKGRARLEGVRVHSADADATLEGYVELRDPLALSQVHAYLKFRPSDALAKREPTIELLTNALANLAKRPDGFMGIQLTGTLGAIFPIPSKDPPFGVTTKNEPVPPGATTTTPPPPPTPAFTPPPNAPPPSPSEPPAAAAAPGAAPPPGPPPSGTPPPAGTATPSGGAAAPPAGTPPPAAPSGAVGPPPPGGGELMTPPPTTGGGSGTTVAPPPSMRTMRAEPGELPPPKPEGQ